MSTLRRCVANVLSVVTLLVFTPACGDGYWRPTLLKAEVIKLDVNPFAALWYGRPCPGDVIVHLLSPRLQVYDQVQFQIEILNVCQGCTAVIPPGSHLLVSEDRPEGDISHFAKSAVPLMDGIACYSSTTVIATLKPKLQVISVSALPAKLRIEVIDVKGSLTPWGSAIIDFPFHAYHPVFATQGREYNILLIGFPGAGKSTYIMSAFAALSLGVEQELPRDAGQRKGHNTRQITKYDLSSMTGDASLHIRLWDTWGVCEGACSTRDFSPDFLKRLADGLVPDGYNLSEYNATELEYHESRVQAFAETDRMDAVLFVMKAAEVRRDPERSLAKKYIAYIQDLGYRTLVVLTWMHDICGSNNTQACADAEVSRVSKSFGIPPHVVMPFTRGEVVLTRHKDSSVSREALVILERAKINAEDHYLKHSPSTTTTTTTHREIVVEAFASELRSEPGTQGTPLDRQWQEIINMLKTCIGISNSTLGPFEDGNVALPALAIVGATIGLLMLFCFCSSRFSHTSSLDKLHVYEYSTGRASPSSMSQFICLRRILESVPERRRSEAQPRMMTWENGMLLCSIVVLGLCSVDIRVQNVLFPPRWDALINTDCARSDSLKLDAVKAVSDGNCRTSCQLNRDCCFYSFGPRTCQLYKQCDTPISKYEFNLYTKSATSLQEFAPQVVLNTIAILLSSLSGIFLVLTLLLMAFTSGVLLGLIDCLGLYSNHEEVIRAFILQLFSFLILVSIHQRHRECVDRILREESSKPERLKQIERELWAEVKRRGNIANKRYRHMSFTDVIVGVLMVSSILYIVYYISDETFGQTGGAWQLNIANILSRSFFGVDANRTMRAIVFSIGLCVASSPLILGLKKCERGVLGLAFDPRDDLKSAMESVALHTLDVEQELKEMLLIQDGAETANPALDDEPSVAFVKRLKIERGSPKSIESKILRRARQCMREYADALQVTPTVLFNRDSLLDEGAAAVHESMERGKGFIRGAFEFCLRIFTGGLYCPSSSSRTATIKHGRSTRAKKSKVAETTSR